MKKVFFVTVATITMVAGMDLAWSNLRNVTENNVQWAARNFAAKLIKGKLDAKGYKTLRERVGPLAEGQVLEPGLPVFMEGIVDRRDQDRQVNRWYVPVSKTYRNTVPVTCPIFVAIVQCETWRSRQSIRTSPYEWFPDCKVQGVDLQN
jgi:hypothetical protein